MLQGVTVNFIQMNQTSFFKLGGIALAAWAALGNAGFEIKSFIILAVFMLLIALLDAGQAAGLAESSRDVNAKADPQAFWNRFLGISGAPFYLALMILVFVSTQSRESHGGADDPLRLQALAASGGMCGGGCGSGGGGCGSGGCGSSKGGSCGCGSKSQPKSAPAAKPQPAGKALTQEELKQRAEIVQKRAMTPPQTANLPGINGRPLPAGLTVNPSVSLPHGIESTSAKPLTMPISETEPTQAVRNPNNSVSVDEAPVTSPSVPNRAP